MEKNIKKILEDIYSVDKSLKAHEDSLIIIVRELILARPETKIDQNFISELRLKLLEKVETLKEVNPQKTMTINSVWPFRKFVFAGATIAVIAAVVFLSWPKESNQLAVRDMGEKAFGEILFTAQTSGENTRDASLQENGDEKPLSESAPFLGGGDVSVDAFYYQPANYSYIYKGEGFEISNNQGEVYRRALGNSAGQELAKVISKMNLNFIDLGNFQNTKINSIEISEDREFGYSIYADLRQNTFSISMNWEKWPNRENFSAPSKTPTDEEIIAISDKFISDYGLDVSKYGKGEVIEAPMLYIMEKSADGDSRFAATVENFTVVYPLVIEGQTVYDQGGQKYGLSVNVDLRYNKVTGIYNIVAGNFESSRYKIVTDANRILEFAENGGMYGNYTYPEAQKTIVVEFGDPEAGLVQIWSWESENNSSKELFVPALIFPILSEGEESGLYRNSIVVPLVGEMMEQNDGGIRVLESAPQAE